MSAGRRLLLLQSKESLDIEVCSCKANRQTISLTMAVYTAAQRDVTAPLNVHMQQHTVHVWLLQGMYFVQVACKHNCAPCLMLYEHNEIWA